VPSPVFITAEDVSLGKPNPEVYLKAAAGLGIAPEKCLVFEDAPLGIAAGQAAGMKTVAVLTTYPASEFPAGVPLIADFRSVVLMVSEGELLIEL
jgi:sugar-phosphatase